MSRWPQAWPLLTTLKENCHFESRQDSALQRVRRETRKWKERRRKVLSRTLKPRQFKKPQIQTDFLSSSDPISLSLSLSFCLPSLPSLQQSGFGEIKAQLNFAPSHFGVWIRSWNQCVRGRQKAENKNWNYISCWTVSKNDQLVSNTFLMSCLWSARNTKSLRIFKQTSSWSRSEVSEKESNAY